MHECPECWSICYCDLDDSNDCRDHGRCYHQCPPDEEHLEWGAEEDDGAEGKGIAEARFAERVQFEVARGFREERDAALARASAAERERDEARAAIDYAMSERHAMAAERDAARAEADTLRRKIVEAVAPLVADTGEPPEEMVRRAVSWGLERERLRRLCEERRQVAHILSAPDGPEGQEDR